MKYILISILAISFISANPVQAEDGKNYNASSCVAFVGDGKRLNFSNIFNTSSTQNLRVDCVATKDIIAKDIKDAWIEVKDLSSSENVSCSLISHNNVVGATSGRIFSQTRSTSGINSNWQRLSYGGLVSASNSHYYFSCSLPKRTSNGASFLGTYSVTERT